MAFLSNLFGKNKDGQQPAIRSNVNQSALNLIMDQIKDLIEINTSLNKKYRDLESKLSGLNADVGTDKRSVVDLQKKLSELQSNMEKFIGLYEVITNQFNPFVDIGEETDNYEIDSEGNPVPFKRPSYKGPGSSGNFARSSMTGMEGAGGLGGTIIQHGVEPEGAVSFPGKNEGGVLEEAVGVGGEMLEVQKGKDEHKEEIVNLKTHETPFFYDTHMPEEKEKQTGILDKLDVNAIVPLTGISGNVNSITTVLSWMVYLSKQCGENSKDVLSYYTSIGWITSNVSKVLTSYLDGIHVKPDDDSDGKMDVSDHVVSLFFIAKIKGVNVNAKTYKLISRIVKSKGFIIED